MKNAVYEALAVAALADEPVALGILNGVKGSSPQKAGAKAVFFGDGRIAGTLGGGCLEAEVQQRALGALASGQPAVFELVLDHDFGWDDGLICGGKVEGLILPNAQRRGVDFWRGLAAPAGPVSWGVAEDFSIRSDPAAQESGWRFRETVCPPETLWIAGAGHIARAVAPLARELDFEVTVFDDRPALVSREFFGDGIGLEVGLWEQLCERPLPPGPAYGLIVTRGHRHDALVLRHWVHKPFVFLGMIGSRRKARTIMEHFTAEKLATAEQLRRVSCPVGVDIGSRTVPEIAISILAQFIQKRAEAGGC